MDMGSPYAIAFCHATPHQLEGIARTNVPSQPEERLLSHRARALADKMCLIVARDDRATCWINDGPLRDECRVNGVPSMHGLRPLIMLVEAGALALDVAVGTVELISANNPYITAAIVYDFRRLAVEADRRHRRAAQQGRT